MNAYRRAEGPSEEKSKPPRWSALLAGEPGVAVTAWAVHVASDGPLVVTDRRGGFVACVVSPLMLNLSDKAHCCTAPDDVSRGQM